MKKTFDTVAFTRKRREELSREYRNLSSEEIRRRIGEALKDDPLWHRFEGGIVHPANLRGLAVRERKEKEYGKPDD